MWIKQEIFFYLYSLILNTESLQNTILRSQTTFHFKDWKYSTRILLTYNIFFSVNFDSLINLYPWNCFKSKNSMKNLIISLLRWKFYLLSFAIFLILIHILIKLFQTISLHLTQYLCRFQAKNTIISNLFIIIRI